MGYDEARDRQLFEDSAMSQQPTVPDRLRWLLQTFKYQKNIRIHAFNEEGMEPYPHGWDVWSNGIKAFMEEKGIAPNWIYTSEESDAPQFREHLGIETVLIDPKRTFMNISGAQIRENPFRYWDYIPTEVKPFFVRTVAILGGESSGKSTLVNKLANIFNTTSAWEYGRDYVFSHLGGDEMALQYSDYDKIALGHAQYIDFAVKYANKVAFIDTDFVTTQAFCKKYEGREHPFVQALIDEYRFDLVILLENNTPWVADGMRSLGSSVDRKEFQTMLVEMLHENNVEFVHVEASDYDTCFLRCVELVKEMMGSRGKFTGLPSPNPLPMGRGIVRLSLPSPRGERGISTQNATTTFPRICPSSTLRWASVMLSTLSPCSVSLSELSTTPLSTSFATSFKISP